MRSTVVAVVLACFVLGMAFEAPAAASSAKSASGDVALVSGGAADEAVTLGKPPNVPPQDPPPDPPPGHDKPKKSKKKPNKNDPDDEAPDDGNAGKGNDNKNADEKKSE